MRRPRNINAGLKPLPDRPAKPRSKHGRSPAVTAIVASPDPKRIIGLWYIRESDGYRIDLWVELIPRSVSSVPHWVIMRSEEDPATGEVGTGTVHIMNDRMKAILLMRRTYQSIVRKGKYQPHRYSAQAGSYD